MTRYNPNNPKSIEEIFTREGDALARAGFVEPDLTKEPEGFSKYTEVDLSDVDMQLDVVATGFDGTESCPETVAQIAEWIVRMGKEGDYTLEEVAYLNGVLDLDDTNEPNYHRYLSVEQWDEDQFSVFIDFPEPAIAPQSLK